MENRHYKSRKKHSPSNFEAMSRAMHLITQNVPGYRPSDGRCLPCSGISGRAVAVSPSSSRGEYSHIKTASVKCSSKGATFVCKASSSGHRRNPDFSRQRKQGFSGNRNRQNEERDSFELGEPDMLSSQNGHFHSISSTPKYQATATPGPREKEIVELFRKVQAQLRERAAIKEEKKIEALQGQGKDSETVDSLLKLLRKHSVEQSKRKVSASGSREFCDQTEQNGSFNAEKNTNFFDSIRHPRDEPQETNGSSFTRPISNFRRKSPVPRVKYRPIYSDKDTINSIPHVNSGGNREKNLVETLPEPKRETEPLQDPHAVLELDPEPIFSSEDVYGEMSEDESSDNETAYTDEDAETQEADEIGELSALKLLELKALAKSRGMKGFSKLKKSELVELLSRS